MTTMRENLRERRFGVMYERSHPKRDQHQANSDKHYGLLLNHTTILEINQSAEIAVLRRIAEVLEKVIGHVIPVAQSDSDAKS